MKKFFMILCGILIMGNAFGAKTYQKLNEITDNSLRDKWGVRAPWDYTKENLSGKFMPSKYIGSNNLKGACGTDEGSGLAIIATDIFSNGNGAKFCMRQIQSANGKRHSWIDIYSIKDKTDRECPVFCKSGHYGRSCADTTFECDYTDYTAVFGDITLSDNLEVGDTYCDDTSSIKTWETPAFQSLIDEDYGGTDTASQAIVLGVLEVKPHGIIVGPVEIHARREKGSHTKSWIESVKGNGYTTVLCAAGYVANIDENDCVPASPCVTEAEMLNRLCSGYNKDSYNADYHVLLPRTEQNCYYFHCQNNKGFSSANDTTCIECPGGKLAYVDPYTGRCEKCEKGKIAKNTHDGCWTENEVTQYSKDQMKSNGNRQCWLETDGRKFSGCVHECPGTTPCYINGNCKACD